MALNTSYAQIAVTPAMKSSVMNYAHNPSRNIRFGTDGSDGELLSLRLATGSAPNSGGSWTTNTLVGNIGYATSWQYSPFDDRIYSLNTKAPSNVINKISYTSSATTVEMTKTLSRNYYGIFIDPFDNYIYLMTTPTGGDIYRIRKSDLSGEELITTGLSFTFNSSWGDKSGFVLGNRLYWADVTAVYSIGLSDKSLRTEVGEALAGSYSCSLKLSFGVSGRENAISFTRTNYSNNVILFYEIMVPPSAPVNSTPTIGTKNFGDVVHLSWNPVSVPTQPGGIILDINKVFYEIFYLPNGSPGPSVDPKLETTSVDYEITAGGSSLSKFSVRSYVLYQGVKVFSPYMYTNTFTTDAPPSNAILPSALIFDGSTSYSINNRIIPTTGSWTIEFSFKTTQSNGYMFAMDNGTNHVVICQLSSSGLNVIIDGQGGSTPNVNDNKIHHVGIVQSGGVTSVYLDGVLKYSITRAIPTISPANVYLGDMGYDYTGKPKYNGIITLPRFWNTARTAEQLKQYRSVTVPDNESGLIDYLRFDPLTGLVKLKKNVYTVTSNGILEWILLFMSLIDVTIPYPDYSQRKENLDYLRTKTNEFRSNNGLNTINWTDPVVVQGITPIRAIHWNEVEDGILEVYETIGQAIESPQVQEQLSNTILPKDLRFPIKDLQGRMVNIVKGLKNN